MADAEIEASASQASEATNNQAQQPSMIGSFFRGVGRAVSSLFWCNDPEEEELQNTD